MSDLRLFNRAAVKEHALKCSKEKRAGKFTRVGEDFFEEMEAGIEAIVREALAKAFIDPCDLVQPAVCAKFATGVLLERMGDALNAAIPRMIQKKVQRQPSCGCTIGRTH